MASGAVLTLGALGALGRGPSRPMAGGQGRWRRRGPGPETRMGVLGQSSNMCAHVGRQGPDRPCSSLLQLPSQRCVFSRPHRILERCPAVLLGTVQCPRPARLRGSQQGLS